MKTLAPTQQYLKLDHAYQYYNHHLFRNELPECIITLQVKANTAGYYAQSRYKSTIVDEQEVDEISMNPEEFDKNPKEVLQTLVHEMVHLWQHRLRKPPRHGYHNHEWADMMEKVGLMPSSTGQPGGKRVGQNMSDYIIPLGLFDQKTDELIKDKVIYYKVERTKITAEKREKKNRKKYSCPECNMALWGKPDLNVICGECDVYLEEQ